MAFRVRVFLAVMMVSVGRAGAIGNVVLDFDGDDFVVIPDSPSLNPSEITVERRVVVI